MFVRDVEWRGNPRRDGDVGGGGGDCNGAGHPIRLVVGAAVAEHRAMADDIGPWSLWDFARHHAGARIARKAAGYLRRFDVTAATLGEAAQRHVAYQVKRKHPGSHVYGTLEPQFRAALEDFAERLRLAAYARVEVGLPRLVKRVLMAGGHVVSAQAGERRRTLTPDDMATLDIDFAQDALVGPRLRFDGVTVTARVTPAMAPRQSGGRPPEYDWEAFTRWLGSTVFKDGFPERKADLLRKAQRWFMETYGREPAESAIKTRLNRFYAESEIGQKPRRS